MADTPSPGERRPGTAPCELPAVPNAPNNREHADVAGQTGSAGRARPPAARPRRDPRDEVGLAELDVPGLNFVGGHQTALQGQVAEKCYRDRSEAGLSRRVHRWLKYKLVGVERFMAMGCNQLWLTEKGARVLIEGGHATADQLFPRTRPIAPKDLAHHLTIVDLSILAERGVPFAASVIQPAWVLQRVLNPNPPAVPDLLLAAPNANGTGLNVLAYEVDLGTEALKVFVPKLRLLVGLLPDWARGGAARVCILTRGSGRAVALKQAVSDLGVPVVVELLPRATGRASLVALGAVLSRGASGERGGLRASDL